MKARKMFEKLGYEYLHYIRDDGIEEEFIEYSKTRYKIEYVIEFNLLTKQIEFINGKRLTGSWHTIELKELQAINKQVEELGWNIK